MNEKLYKEELRNILKHEYGMSEREAADALNKFFGLIAKALEEERYVKIKGLGIFKLIDVESRKSVDVNTGKSIEIPGHRKVSYSVDSALKELINRPFAHFETVELKDVNLMAEEGGYADVVEMKESDVSAEEVVEVEKPLEVKELEAESAESVGKVEESMENVTEEAMEPMVEEVKKEIYGGENPLGEAIRVKPESRREEWRRLEREMDREERNNKIALLVISILMFLFMLAGLLFILAPEFLEKLFY